jgi:hypothetical protein
MFQRLAGTFEEGQLNDIFENYISSDGLHLDTGRLRADVQQMLDALANEPTAPIYDDYLTDARAQIDSENQEIFADLDNLLNTRTGLYNRQLSDISRGYNDMRSNLLSQQYRQNNQLIDTLQSGMDRSRRNALEAGATAGIRIAGNINTLLSVQNKQSATSMDTANQLAQMMVNQRNAENSVRSAYTDALGEDTANRHAIKLGSEGRASSLANTNYQSAQSSYDAKRKDWDTQNFDNPLYDYRTQLKSKYNNVNVTSPYFRGGR